MRVLLLELCFEFQLLCLACGRWPALCVVLALWLTCATTTAVLSVAAVCVRRDGCETYKNRLKYGAKLMQGWMKASDWTMPS